METTPEMLRAIMVVDELAQQLLNDELVDAFRDKLNAINEAVLDQLHLANIV